MSLKRKLFLGLMLALLVSLPAVSSEQAPPDIPYDVSQHEINVWQAKVDFWRTWEAHQRLLDDHTARTWEAKVEFWQNFDFDTE